MPSPLSLSLGVLVNVDNLGKMSSILGKINWEDCCNWKSDCIVQSHRTALGVQPSNMQHGEIATSLLSNNANVLQTSLYFVGSSWFDWICFQQCIQAVERSWTE